MTAGITVRNNRAEMAYVGETPWHGMANRLTPGQPIETWQKESGLSWKVQRSKVRYATSANDKSLREWSDQHVLFRSDTKAPLSVVSDKFQIVQPGECLEFFRDLTEKHGFELETAGTMFGGRRYWALAKTPLNCELPGKDRLGAYLLLATACDGSMATTAKMTSIRVVCHNTLSMALSAEAAARNQVRVRHNSKFIETEVKIDMGLIDTGWTEFQQQIKSLAKCKLSTKDALDVLLNVLGDPAKLAIDTAKDGREAAIEAQPNMKGMASILKLFDGEAIGADLPSSKGTAWGLVNATTQYFDHLYGRDPSRRLSKAWFGKNDTAKTEVARNLLERIEA